MSVADDLIHTNFGRIPEWPNGADCKSADVRLRWFESIFSHKFGNPIHDRGLDFRVNRPRVGAGSQPLPYESRPASRGSGKCGSSSVDRALAFQAKGREFEPRLPLYAQPACDANGF